MPHDISRDAVPGRETSSVPRLMPLPWLVIRHGNGPDPGGTCSQPLSRLAPLVNAITRHGLLRSPHCRSAPQDPDAMPLELASRVRDTPISCAERSDGHRDVNT
jgi:hypothetical protein